MSLYLPYSEPRQSDICVAFCFFNPTGYIRPLQNTVFFQEKLRLAKIPYYSIEMLIGDKPPMLANPTLRVRSKSSLFYKEALWNRLEREIPPQYTKVAFLDSDIIFSDPDWLDKISILLDSCDIVHPFETVDRLNLAYEKLDTLVSSVKTPSVIGAGFGWALTRDYFHRIGGFFENDYLGNNDMLFYYSITSENFNANSDKYSLIKDMFIPYMNQVKSTEPSITYLNTHIYHLSHGTLKNRKYGDRHVLTLGGIKESWDSLFSLNSDGFWELTDDSLNKKMIDYFVSRNEDSQEKDYVETTIDIKPVTQKTLMNAPRPMLMRSLQGEQTPKLVQKNPEPPAKVYPPRLNTLKPLPIAPRVPLRLPVAIPLQYLSTKRK